jgi:hypothetical protein
MEIHVGQERVVFSMAPPPSYSSSSSAPPPQREEIEENYEGILLDDKFDPFEDTPYNENGVDENLDKNLETAVNEMYKDGTVYDDILEVGNSVDVNIARVRYMIDTAFAPIRLLACEDSLYYVNAENPKDGFYDKPLYDMQCELQKRPIDRQKVLILGPKNFMRPAFVNKEGKIDSRKRELAKKQGYSELTRVRVWNGSACKAAISLCFDLDFLCGDVRKVYEEFLVNTIKLQLSLKDEELKSLTLYLQDRIKLLIYFAKKYPKNIESFISMNRVPIDVTKNNLRNSVFPYVLTSFDEMSKIIQFPIEVVSRKKVKVTHDKESICLRCLKLSY